MNGDNGRLSYCCIPPQLAPDTAPDDLMSNPEADEQLNQPEASGGAPSSVDEEQTLLSMDSSGATPPKCVP